MKKLLLLFLYLLCQRTLTLAQDSTNISSGWGKLDYSVPESPVSKVLENNTSSILRPSTTREIAISVGNYLFQNNGALPKNIAVEISPGLLQKNLDLAEYKKNRFLYRSRISFGTSVKENGSYDLAIGLNFTILDKTDLRTIPEFTKTLVKITKDNLNYKDEVRKRIDEQERDLTRSQVDGILDDSSNSKHIELKAKEEEMMKLLVDEQIFRKIEDVEEVRKRFKDLSWNKAIVQVGIAAMFPSSDSLIRNLEGLSRTGIWISAGLPSGKHGQWLLGARLLGMETNNNPIEKWDVSAGSRYYYGSNEYKVYLEAEGIAEESNFKRFKYSFDVGGEINLLSGLWLDFSFGLTKPENQKAEFTPSLNLRFGSPEKKK